MHSWNAPALESVKRRLERLPHALLVHGPRGVGKLALAERIAQLLLCEAQDTAAKPCGACSGCRWFLAGNHPDFRRVEPEALAKEAADPESEEERPARRGKPSVEIKIEQVRELAGFLGLASHRGRLRVALVHPADAMNIPASNALLKSLEEPPSGAVFVLVAHRPAQLLPTVRSRCVALPVPIPPAEAALPWLAGQGVKSPERWLAYAGGAPLRALGYAAAPEALARFLRPSAPVEQREELEPLIDALQKTALDRALAALGLPKKYGTAGGAGSDEAYAWLRFARWMGENRALARQPLNPRLFSAEMLSRIPGDLK